MWVYRCVEETDKVHAQIGGGWCCGTVQAEDCWVGVSAGKLGEDNAVSVHKDWGESPVQLATFPASFLIGFACEKHAGESQIAII